MLKQDNGNTQLNLERNKFNDRTESKKYMGQGKRIGDQSLYFFELDKEKKITNLEKVRVFKRVRDLIYKNNS